MYKSTREPTEDKKSYVTVEIEDKECVIFPEPLRVIDKNIVEDKDFQNILVTKKDATRLANKYLFSTQCPWETNTATVHPYSKKQENT